MKKKIMVSLMMIALVATLIGGATFAIFTDTATNTNNTFSAGTLDVNALNQAITVPIDNIAPGDTISGSFVVENNCSLDMWYRVKANVGGSLFAGATPAVVEFDPANGGLASDVDQTVNFSVKLPVAADNTYQAAEGTLSFTVDAQQMANNPSPVW